MASKEPTPKPAINRVDDNASSRMTSGVIQPAAQLARDIPIGEVSRFTQLAVFSAAINLGLPVLLHEWMGMAQRAAVAVALTTAFGVNFLVARSYVFKAGGVFGPQLLRFAAVSADFRIAEYVAFLTLHTFFGLYYLFALGAVLVVSFGLKFVFYRTYVFRPNDNDWPRVAIKWALTLVQRPYAARKAFAIPDALILGVLFGYYLFYPQPGFEGLIPDNIAQTAYWSLLTRPDLVGSIGSSSPKGGLIVALGAAHYLSYEVLENAWPFKAMLAILFAGSLYLIGRIAADIGGPIAGVLAVLVAAGSTYLTQTFYSGSSNLFFLPPVLLGMLFLSIGKDRAAILALCVAATVRPEALIIVGLVIAIRYLSRGDWRTSIEFTGYGAITLLFFVLLAYWTQGAWNRIGGGEATGYPEFASLGTLEHMRVTVGQFFSERFVVLLLLPALFAIAQVKRARTHLYFYSMTLTFIVLVVIDFFGMHYRYIAAGQVIIFALGCGGLMQIYSDLRRPRLAIPPVSTIIATTAVVGLTLAEALQPVCCCSRSRLSACSAPWRNTVRVPKLSFLGARLRLWRLWRWHPSPPRSRRARGSAPPSTSGPRQSRTPRSF